jgi:hypothetical protein
MTSRSPRRGITQALSPPFSFNAFAGNSRRELISAIGKKSGMW